MDNTDEMTTDQFYEKYRPIPGPEGDMSLTHGQALQYPDNRIWTITDDEEGNLYVGAGYHAANRLNYVATEVPWETGMEVAEWWIMDIEEPEITKRPPVIREYHVQVPVSFNASFYLYAESEEHAKNLAVEQFSMLSTEDRVQALGADLMQEEHGDGGVIGEPLVWSVEELDKRHG